MNIGERCKRSWHLIQVSVSILQRHPKFLVFPVVTTFFSAVILLFFIAPVALRPTGYPYSDARHWEAVYHRVFHETSVPAHVAVGSSKSVELEMSGTDPSTKSIATPLTHSPDSHSGLRQGEINIEDRPHLTAFGMAYCGAAYFLSMVLATYFNVAFYHEILSALRGNDVSIRRGLAFALTRWQAVLLWATFAGLVGLLIRQLEERVAFFGKLVIGLIGTAWSVASIFVVPVLVMESESINPFGMLKKSALTLKKSWGEALIGFVGVQAGGMLVAFGSVLLALVAIAISVIAQSVWVAIVTGVVWLSTIITLSYFVSVANHVYRCALYLYATEQTVPEPYSLELLQMAWKMKKVKP